MAITPYYTSNDLIDAVKRKILFPTSQQTFSDDDILAFANEETMISQVPSILKYHQEYFVTVKIVPLVANISQYEIPDRAIGMKLRDLFWQDAQGNLFEMTRVNSDDRAFFQRNVGANTAISKFYLQENFVVLTPLIVEGVTGSLYMVYYRRPNQLVTNDQAAIAQNFTRNITVNNATLLSGDTVTIGSSIFTAGTDFAIGGTSIITATNLNNAINSQGIYSSNNGNPSTNILLISYLDLSVSFSTSNTSAFSIQISQGIQFDNIPTEILNGSIIDFLQTKAGHRIKGMDITIPNNGISGTIINFNASDIPTDFIVGDYICLANECIIPQIPSDLHNSLAERTSARILAALGDQMGLQISNTKIQDIEKSQGPLLDARVEGAPQKILNRYSLLRLGKMGPIRKY